MAIYTWGCEQRLISKDNCYRDGIGIAKNRITSSSLGSTSCMDFKTNSVDATAKKELVGLDSGTSSGLA